MFGIKIMSQKRYEALMVAFATCEQEYAALKAKYEKLTDRDAKGRFVKKEEEK